MTGLIKKMFIGLLNSIVSIFDRIKCMPLTNDKCMTQPTLINLYSNECIQELHYYPFAAKLDRRIGRCNTLKGWSNKECVQNKKEDFNIPVFNMVTGKNQSEILTKDISWKCNCKFDGGKCNSDRNWNYDKCWCKCKKHHICKKRLHLEFCYM